jgi:hypothetical protein
MVKHIEAVKSAQQNLERAQKEFIAQYCDKITWDPKSAEIALRVVMENLPIDIVHDSICNCYILTAAKYFQLGDFQTEEDAKRMQKDLFGY